MIPLRKSTASQEVLLGPFLDDTDGKTAETALTINASDIKLWKRGGTTESSKNSGGATHIASGRYHATLDATDTDTTGELILNVAVAGALPVRLVCHVYEAAIFDAFFASGAAGYQLPIWSSASATVNLSGTTVKAVTDGVSLGSAVITSGSFASGAITAASIAASALNGKGDWQTVIWSSPTATVNLSGTTVKAVTDSVAATISDKTGFKLASDGLAAISAWTVAITGNLTGNVSGSVNSVATTVSANVTQWNGGALPTIGTSTLTAQQVWEYGTRTLSAFGFTVSANVVQWNGASLPTIGTSTLTAQQVWEYATRTLSAFGFTVAANVTQWNGGSLPTIGTSTLTAQQVWEYATRTVSAFSFTVAANVTQWDGGALPTIPTAGENADAVWDEVMSGHTTAGTYGGRIPRSDSSNVNVKLTGSAHIAADIHELQPAVIESQHFALGAIDANAVAADASSEIATAVRAELGTELARIDVTVGSRLATIGYTAPPTATTIADTVLGRSVSNVEATASEHSICTLVLAALESSVIGTSWTIKRTDGTTTHATKTVTTDASAEPITGVA